VAGKQRNGEILGERKMGPSSCFSVVFHKKKQKQKTIEVWAAFFSFSEVITTSALIP